MPYVEDNFAYPTMVRLAACVETTIADRGLPGLCQSVPVPGPMAVMDRCGSCSKGDSGKCSGQAWVRLVNEFPSSNFPTTDTTSSACDAPIAVTLEVGIARCLPTGRANSITGYDGPSTTDLLEATRLQLADKSALRAAIQCCMSTPETDLTYVLGTYQPMQVTGDCGGGFWQVTVWSV